MADPIRCWRCFPWDPAASEGAPFSASYLAPGQTVGRFDLHDRPPVRYFAESPVHAVGEALAEFRGTLFRPSQLIRRGQPLALVAVRLAPSILERIPDCTDPKVLGQLTLRPDQFAHHDRRVTQGIARQLHTQGHAGLRWWSALTGAWHTTVLFSDRVHDAEIQFETPTPLTADHPAVLSALPVLGIRRDKER